MPGGKRTKKSVSYTEHDDDDGDFITKVDNSKKVRETKSEDDRKETKTSSRQAPRKREEKLSKAEQEQLDLALQLSKDTVQMNEVSVELPVIPEEKKTINSQSSVSSHEEPTVVENESDENSSPKCKRMKRKVIEEESEEESDNDEEEEGEEEDEPVLPKKPVDQTKKISEVPTVTNIDLNSKRSTTRVQEKSSVPSLEPAKKKSNVPVGFPTSKIVIPSLPASRVGLSRKSSTIKPLHRNLNPRVVHE